MPCKQSCRSKTKLRYLGLNLSRGYVLVKFILIQACRTLLNLSICKEKDGYAAIRPLYEEALKRADAAKDVKLKVRALENLSVVQENLKLLEEARQLHFGM